MSDFQALQEYVVESISRPVKYIIYKLTEFIRVVDKFVFRQVPAGAASGYANIEKVEGNTVAWDQLVDTGDTTCTVSNGHVYYANISGTASIATSDGNAFAVDGSTDNVVDLTAIFGAGNEPTTVADFEAWLAQNIGTLPYYDYNAGELLSVKMSGMQTEDSSQQTLDTIALDVTTITGINTATNVREVIFADGMNKASDSDVDIIDLTTDTAERATFVLPNTYQELEWLKSDGNAYIQTSLLVNRSYTYKLKFNITDFNYSGWVIGAKVSSAGSSDDFGVSTGAIRFGTQYVNKDFTTYNDVELIINGVGYTINGENTEWINTPTVNNDRTLKLFWAQNSTAQKLGKIYYLQILDSDGVSLLHLIPAKRIADSVLGMYDIVSNTFLPNAGTGDFVAGPVVVKNVYPITPITYTDLQDANGNPLNPRYKVEQGGTEQVLPVNTSTPTTVAPTLTTVYTKDNN